MREEHRLEIVRNIKCVDEVYLQETTDPTPVLERIRPDIFTHGDDWTRLIRGNETLERLGIEFVLLPYTSGISTTRLRYLLSEADGWGRVLGHSAWYSK